MSNLENTTTLWELPNNITIVRAQSDADLDIFIEIHEEAARWLWDQGIHQWKPGIFQKAWIIEPMQRGEVYLARQQETPVATIVLEWADEYNWGKRPNDAGYVHGLRMRRNAAGQGIGLALLRWSEGQVAAAGRTYLRLDCQADNPKLVAYYVNAGFTRVEDIEVEPGWWPAHFERRIAWNCATPSGELTVTLAQTPDVEAILALWNDSDEWMRARGLEPGAPPIPLRDIVTNNISRGVIYVAHQSTPTGKIVGTITLEWMDDDVWGEIGAVDDAIYVHGFTTSRQHARQGVGQALLGWVEEMAHAAGKHYLRLDCDATNPALRAYYERAGLAPRGEIVVTTHHAARFEKLLVEEKLTRAST